MYKNFSKKVFYDVVCDDSYSEFFFKIFSYIILYIKLYTYINIILTCEI